MGASYFSYPGLPRWSGGRSGFVKRVNLNRSDNSTLQRLKSAIPLARSCSGPIWSKSQRQQIEVRDVCCREIKVFVHWVPRACHFPAPGHSDCILVHTLKIRWSQSAHLHLFFFFSLLSSELRSIVPFKNGPRPIGWLVRSQICFLLEPKSGLGALLTLHSPPTFHREVIQRDEETEEETSDKRRGRYTFSRYTN